MTAISMLKKILLNPTQITTDNLEMLRVERYASLEKSTPIGYLILNNQS